ESIGGQVLLTSDIENYMGYHFITGRELIEKFQTQVEQFPIDIAMYDGAAKIMRDSEAITIATKNGRRYSADTVILATGKRSRPLGVPGEKDFVGRGVTYCSICDGPFFKGLDVAIIGGGNSGITSVVDMIKIANRIYSIDIANDLRADPVLVERAKASNKVEFLLGYKTKEIRGSNVVESIILENCATGELVEKAVGGVFIEIGLIPNSDLVEGFVELNRWKEIVIDSACRTSAEGVFAAGDVTDVPEKQIIVAAGEGAKASLSAYHYLIRKKGKDSK
ncbi:MAG: FAD-dependent oxidoreductase, partial [bacterium]